VTGFGAGLGPLPGDQDNNLGEHASLELAFCTLLNKFSYAIDCILDWKNDCELFYL